MSYVYVDEAFVAQTKEAIVRGDARYDAVRKHLIAQATEWSGKGPWRITDWPSPAASGNLHDYFSEGPYWWPNPDDPDGPYVRRDGEFNPNTFTAHLKALYAVCDSVKALALAGYYLDEPKWARKAAEIVYAWFLDPKSRMNPHLEYGQAIRGRCEGRGIGIIDTNCLVGLVHALSFLERTGEWLDAQREGMRAWLHDYLTWMSQSEKGLDEKRRRNNHGTYWAVQAGTYAAYLGEYQVVDEAIEIYQTRLVPMQIDPSGAQPHEEARTRSLSYSVMNAEGLALLCELGRLRGVDLWTYEDGSGRGIKQVVHYLAPYIAEPGKWTKQQIVDPQLGPQLFLHWAALRLGEPAFAAINDAKEGVGSSLLGPLALLPGGSA